MLKEKKNHVAVQVHAFGRKPKNLKVVYSGNKKLKALTEVKENHLML